MDDGISSIMAALPQFHSRTGSLISLSNGNRTAQRNQPTQEFNNGVVLSAEPLRDNQLFEVKIVKKVIHNTENAASSDLFGAIWRADGGSSVGQVVVVVSCVCTRLCVQYFMRQSLCFPFRPVKCNDKLSGLKKAWSLFSGTFLIGDIIKHHTWYKHWRNRKQYERNTKVALWIAYVIIWTV